LQAALPNRQQRKRLLSLVGDDSSDGRRLIVRLRELRVLEKFPVFSAALGILARLNLPDERSEQILSAIVEHREQLAAKLGRDPGLRVSAMDYLSNVETLLRNPAVVERAEFEQTERSAVTDSLTRLYNRRYFQSALERELRRCSRYGARLALLMLDFDDFKSVNDLYGHPFGDLVLRRAGSLIRGNLRESDVACRFGGEEITVILPETDRLGAYAVAERLRLAIENGFASRPIRDRIVAMTLSGGLACYPEDGEDGEQIVGLADRAMYRAKTRGKNRIMMHHAERRAAVRFPVAPSVRAELAPTPPAIATRATAVNLSRSGALVAVSNGRQPAGPVHLTLRRQKESVVVEGRIVRIEGADGAKDRQLVAIAFTKELSESSLKRHVSRSSGRRRSPGGRI
jgi:diguanylate cyclase (GGDEF)-like protein